MLQQLHHLRQRRTERAGKAVQPTQRIWGLDGHAPENDKFVGFVKIVLVKRKVKLTVNISRKAIFIHEIYSLFLRVPPFFPAVFPPYIWTGGRFPVNPPLFYVTRFLVTTAKTQGAAVTMYNSTNDRTKNALYSYINLLKCIRRRQSQTRHKNWVLIYRYSLSRRKADNRPAASGVAIGCPMQPELRPSRAPSYTKEKMTNPKMHGEKCVNRLRSLCNLLHGMTKFSHIRLAA